MKIVVLASGEGRTFQNIFSHEQQAKSSWHIVGVITDNLKAGVITRARTAAVPVQLVSPKDFLDRDGWDSALRSAIDSTGADIVFLLGFLRLLGPKTLGACGGRIYNTHPSLLPRHGGKGMYGRRVHEAVIAAGDRESGSSIHAVNSAYDEGVVLARAKIEVRANDTAETLEDRVRTAEITLIIDFLNRMSTN